MSQVIMLFSSYFYLYLHFKDNKVSTKQVLMLLLAGFVIFSMFNTREDAIWILPFVLVITIIFLLLSIKNYNKDKLIKKFLLYLIPIACLLIGNFTISLLNYHYYGIFYTNELKSGGLKNAIESMYSVKSKEKIEYVTVTRQNLKKIYNISPTLNKIKPTLEKDLDNCSKGDSRKDS